MTTTTTNMLEATPSHHVLRTAALTTGVALAANLGVFGLARARDVAPLTLDAGVSVKLTLASLHLITGGFYVAGVAELRRTNTGVVR